MSKRRFNLTKEEAELAIKEQQNINRQCIAEIGFDASESLEEYLQYFKLWLADNNVEKVYIEAYGGGDSGEIHTLDIETSNTAETVKYTNLEFALEIAKDPFKADSSQHDSYYLNYNWGRFSLDPKQNSITEAVEEMFYSVAKCTGQDWYNNEGGAIEMTFQDGSLTYRLSVNIIETETPVDLTV